MDWSEDTEQATYSIEQDMQKTIHLKHHFVFVKK